MDRMSKTTDYFQALGDVDELNAQLGVCMEQLQEEELGDAFPLREIQSRLLDIGM